MFNFSLASQADSLASRLGALKAEKAKIHEVAVKVSGGIDQAILDLSALKGVVNTVAKETE